MNHKEVLELIASLPQDLMDELDEVLNDLPYSEDTEIINSDPPLMIGYLDQELIEHEEGSTLEYQSYLINGAIFTRSHRYDSWDGCEYGELLPAQAETKIVYRSIE